MQISLDGVTVVLSDEHMDKLTNVLAERLLPKLEENWARYLQTQLAEVVGHIAALQSKTEEIDNDFAKIESDMSDLESKVDDHESRMEDFVASDDLDIDSVNSAVSKLEDFDESKLEDLESRVDTLETNDNTKAIIEKIARLLLESVSVMA